MPRIYLPAPVFLNNRISITDEKAHYLASVLRCGKGDCLIIFDGKGNCFRTTIVTADKREVVAEVAEKIPCNLESDLNITLVQGLLKGEKMDMVVQKTTELGVKEILPVITGRSQLRDTKKIARWRKIAEEASRQSGRSMVPVVHETVKFDNFLSVHDSIHGLVFYEEGGVGLTEAVSSLIPRHSSFFVLIGPEGGFTKEEIMLAKEKGLIVTSLGKRILRAETAAISAVTLAQFLLGDMG
ncbi:MAG: 16S rRNA (uracil(1498)-N(3))-methyltransferase [Thermodesulfovibrionales bacterium]